MRIRTTALSHNRQLDCPPSFHLVSLTSASLARIAMSARGSMSDIEGEDAPTVRSGDATSRRKQRRHAEALECHLCVQPMVGGQETRSFRGVAFHACECWPAVRAHRRVLSQNQGRLRASDDLMLEDPPPTWRQDVAPLVVHRGQSRASARSVLQAKVKKLNVKEKKIVKDKLRLDRRRYKSYRMFWDRIGSETASEDFDTALQAQGRRRSKDEYVLLTDNERVREAVGSREETAVASGGESDSSAPPARRRAPQPPPSRAASPPNPGSRRGARNDADRASRRGDRKRHRDAHPESMRAASEIAGSADEDDEAASNSDTEAPPLRSVVLAVAALPPYAAPGPPTALAPGWPPPTQGRRAATSTGPRRPMAGCPLSSSCRPSRP